jgi:hypothetical protein
MRFFPEVRPVSRLEPESITSVFNAKWDEIPFQSEETYGPREREHVEREFSIQDLPPELLEDGGFLKFSTDQFNAMRKLSRRLEKSRRSRETYLDSVFSGPRDL